MFEFFEYIRQFNFLSSVIRIFLSLVAGGLIGLQREKNGHAAGFRTHILVCLGASMTVMTGVFGYSVLGFGGDPLRIAAQVVSGIGFIGAGTILVTQRLHIRGLTTAAGLWSTAAIGLACGIGFYEGALLCTLLILIVMTQFKNLDRALSRHSRKRKIYFEIRSADSLNVILNNVAQCGITLAEIDITAPKSSTPNHVGVNATVIAKNNDDIHNICCIIADLEFVAFAIEAI